MKNRILGLGIFALILSLNLHFSGILEAKKAIPEPVFAKSDTRPQSIFSESLEINFQNGILQQETQSSELNQLLRKYPVVSGVLFVLLNHSVKGNLAQPVAAEPSILPAKDLPVNYHNLRI